MSSPSERRQELLEVLCRRRHDTYDNLAFEFNVSRRTIRRDIAILMCSYPIETSRGYGGGVRACLISSDEDGNEGESKNVSRNNEFTLTIFPKPAEFVQPAEKALYHPTTRQYNKSV